MMNHRHIKLVDQSQTVLAEAQVVDEGGNFGGTIDLGSTPPPIRALFEEFEEIVDRQMFAFLDEIQAKIGSIPIKVLFEDGSKFLIKDLQVYPSTGDISFLIQDLAQRTAKPALPVVEVNENGRSEPIRI